MTENCRGVFYVCVVRERHGSLVKYIELTLMNCQTLKANAKVEGRSRKVVQKHVDMITLDMTRF